MTNFELFKKLAHRELERNLENSKEIVDVFDQHSVVELAISVHSDSFYLTKLLNAGMTDPENFVSFVDNLIGEKSDESI